MAIASVRLCVNNQQFSDAIQQLGAFVSIPSVSNPNSPDYKMSHLEDAAQFAGKRLKTLGFDVRYVRIENSAPFVIAQRIIHENLPTIVLYAHYDVQPVDREKWVGKPFIVEERDERLYGRGASDDKGGIIAILTALRVYQEAGVKLPVNVKILFEGEEEFGSTHMNALLKQEAKNLNAQALVILDGLNRDTQTGTLTSSTRGIVNLTLKVHALDNPVHSGIGCLAPDPAQALARLITSLSDPKKIPGFMDGLQQMDQKERELLKKSSQHSDSYAREMGVVQGASLRGNPNDSIYERVVEEPSLSIVNMHCGQPNGGNSIQDSASCTIGIRTLPGQDPDHIAEVVMKYLHAQPVMHQLPIEVNQEERGAWAWKANLSAPFSQAYLQALKENFPKACAMPCGGALPLLREFEAAFPKMEAIVPGVEDPKSAAHSHNESQDLPLLMKMIDSLIDFLAKAAKIKIKN